MADAPDAQTVSSPRLNWSALARLIRLPNQTGTWLLLWPSWWALWMACRGLPPLRLLAIFGLGAFVMRSAVVIMNDLTDRSIDRRVARTRERPLAAGTVSPAQALAFLALLLCVACGLLFLLPPRVWWLAPIAVLLAALYPLAKRVIAIPQAMLGIAFGWGTIMAWAAVRENIEAPAWLLFAATACWAIAYDTIYAMQDREDDHKVGVRSSALLFGSSAWLAVWVFDALMLVCLSSAGWLTGAGAAFYGSIAAIGGFLAHQAWDMRTLHEPREAFRLFAQHVWVGLALLVGIAVGFA